MLTKAQIGALNDARDVLAAIEKECGSLRWEERENSRDPDGFDYGRLAEAADNAAGAVFNVLNVARAYCGVEITEEQMHNRVQEIEEVTT